ncbi:hypothetical protein [uncultured Psychroserpens sp.]|uniref:hypothetical protein n=1 Tax=uncultured Psychroserpens sp. TaxID=255436 RepID=UPI00262A2FCC|nr:hypothetical protein [uncultured Psychroserpens sp.]
MSISKEDAIQQIQSIEAQELLQQHRKQAITKTPVLAKAYDLVYKAYKRPYVNTGDDVLIIIANGWYFPTPEVKLYFEPVRGKFEYQLMQNNSNAGFNLATYHTAQWTSGLGLKAIPDSILIQDAYGTHTVKVESF